MMSTNTQFITKTTPFFIKNTNIGIFLILFCLLQLIAVGQVQSGFTLAKKANNDVVLYKLNSSTNTWGPVGSTERSYIKSIATDSKNQMIYAVDGGKLGSLNPNSGKFTAIGEIGYGSGEEGNIKMDNIYALAFDANRNILYACQRMDGLDLLLQINPKSGKIIPGSMTNQFGKKVDYKNVLIKTFYFGFVYESKRIIDLTYNSERKELHIVHNYFSTLHGINTYFNIDGKTPEEKSRISPIQKIAGIAINHEGKFFATFYDNKITAGGGFSGGGVSIDLGILKPIDPNADSSTFFFGLDFYSSQPCNSNLQLNSSPMTSTSNIATNSIQSNALINANTKFIAGKSISLNTNFEVPKYVNFEAKIDENVCQ